MVDTPVVMAVVSQIVDGSRCVGIAFVDAATRRLGAAQFEDDEQLCALERVFVQLGAKEVVIPQVRRRGCSVTVRPLPDARHGPSTGRWSLAGKRTPQVCLPGVE